MRVKPGGVGGGGKKTGEGEGEAEIREGEGSHFNCRSESDSTITMGSKDVCWGVERIAASEDERVSSEGDQGGGIVMVTREGEEGG